MHWLSPESRSRALFERARSVQPGSGTGVSSQRSPYPPYLSSARGAWLYDVDGHRFLDLANNDGALLHGHAHPLVTAALAEQLERGTCTSLPGEPELALAELLCGRVPSFERVRFTPDAHRAATWALRAARAATGRERVAWIGPLPHPDAETTAGEDALLLSDQDPDAALDQVAAHGSSLAAVIIDPVPRSRGFQSPASGRLQQIEEVARNAGAVLVFDERDSFRFGFAGAQGRFAGTPELTILGAHVGGGLPAGAVAGIEQVMETLAAEPGIGPVPVGWSAPTNPAAMAAGHAAFSLLDLAAFDHLDRMGEQVRVRLRERASVRDAPVRVGGIGSVFTLRGRVGAPGPDRLVDLQIALLDRGVVLARDASGFLSSVFGEKELAFLDDAWDGALEAVYG